ncbi:MAG: CAP domain-containing protein [Desulfomonile tiedjei]|uniref:CAP domain-containing protein n=1 Tax=Desulfomonile tiedjei TaxID=2358 RepID=A0A9D6V4Q7_9BACT|nr:CAP domain-containing protein [Desulfomonile tiedjei]
METSILRLTNEERVRNGLQRVESSDALAYIAKKQSRHMCDSQVLAHENEAFPDGWRKLIQRLKAINVRSGAENIALRTVEANQDAWSREIVKGWMKSASHRRNILEPKHRYIGIGVVPCESRIAYATQTFSSDLGTAP